LLRQRYVYNPMNKIHGILSAIMSKGCGLRQSIGSAGKIIIISFASALLMSSPIQAIAPIKETPAELKKRTDKENVEKKKDDARRIIDGHLDYLKTYLPKLTASDIIGKSISDLRRLYYDAYRIQGMTVDEATRKSELISPDKHGNGKMTAQAAKEGPMVDGYLAYLKQYLPDLKASDIKGKSLEDVRRIFYEAYRAQGMNMADANRKANQLDLENPANKKTRQSTAQHLKAQRHLDYLKNYLPALTPSDIQGLSDAEMRNLYFQAYCKQGMGSVDARKKADHLDLENAGN